MSQPEEVAKSANESESQSLSQKIKIKALFSTVQLRPTATVVRDRKGRIHIERHDLLSESESHERVKTSIEAHQKRKGVPPPNNALHEFPIIPGVLCEYDAGGWKPMTKDMVDAGENGKIVIRSIPPPESLRIVSWNVWFSEYEWRVRLDGLVRIAVEREKADIVCLQEVTPRFLKRLMEFPIIQQKYRVVTAVRRKSWYGVCMLIGKHNIFNGIPPAIGIVSNMPSQMGRQALIAAFDYGTPAGSSLAIATVHLESLNSRTKRSEQLQLIQQALAGYDNALLVGDYNITDTGPWADLEESCEVLSEHLGPGYVDWWTEKYPGAVGATFDSNANSMLGLHSRFKDLARFDRASLRLEKETTSSSFSWTADGIRVVGDQSIDNDPKGKAIFVSDHFGLAMELKSLRSNDQD